MYKFETINPCQFSYAPALVHPNRADILIACSQECANKYIANTPLKQAQGRDLLRHIKPPKELKCLVEDCDYRCDSYEDLERHYRFALMGNVAKRYGSDATRELLKSVDTEKVFTRHAKYLERLCFSREETPAFAIHNNSTYVAKNHSKRKGRHTVVFSGAHYLEHCAQLFVESARVDFTSNTSQIFTGIVPATPADLELERKVCVYLNFELNTYDPLCDVSAPNTPQLEILFMPDFIRFLMILSIPDLTRAIKTRVIQQILHRVHMEGDDHREERETRQEISELFAQVFVAPVGKHPTAVSAINLTGLPEPAPEGKSGQVEQYGTPCESDLRQVLRVQLALLQKRRIPIGSHPAIKRAMKADGEADDDSDDDVNPDEDDSEVEDKRDALAADMENKCPVPVDQRPRFTLWSQAVASSVPERPLEWWEYPAPSQAKQGRNAHGDFNPEDVAANEHRGGFNWWEIGQPSSGLVIRTKADDSRGSSMKVEVLGADGTTTAVSGPVHLSRRRPRCYFDASREWFYRQNKRLRGEDSDSEGDRDSDDDDDDNDEDEDDHDYHDDYDEGAYKHSLDEEESEVQSEDEYEDDASDDYGDDPEYWYMQRGVHDYDDDEYEEDNDDDDGEFSRAFFEMFGPGMFGFGHESDEEDEDEGGGHPGRGRPQHQFRNGPRGGPGPRPHQQGGPRRDFASGKPFRGGHAQGRGGHAQGRGGQRSSHQARGPQPQGQRANHGRGSFSQGTGGQGSGVPRGQGGFRQPRGGHFQSSRGGSQPRSTSPGSGSHPRSSGQDVRGGRGSGSFGSARGGGPSPAPRGGRGGFSAAASAQPQSGSARGAARRPSNPRQ